MKKHNYKQDGGLPNNFEIYGGEKSFKENWRHIPPNERPGRHFQNVNVRKKVLPIISNIGFFFMFCPEIAAVSFYVYLLEWRKRINGWLDSKKMVRI